MIKDSTILLVYLSINGLIGKKCMYITVDCFRNRKKSCHWDVDNLEWLTEKSQVQREALSVLTHMHNLSELNSGNREQNNGCQMLRGGSSEEASCELGERKPGDLLYIMVTVINKTVF